MVNAPDRNERLVLFQMIGMLVRLAENEGLSEDRYPVLSDAKMMLCRYAQESS